MSTKVKQLSESEVKGMLEEAKVINRLPEEIIEAYKKDGWEFNDYAMEKRHKGIVICIEFCLGDFCVAPYSKKGKWLLEKKKSHESFMMALLEAAAYQYEIDQGKHWNGEEH